MSAKRPLARCRGDVAETGDEPLPCGLIFRSETGSFATCRRVRDVVVIGGADVVVFLRLCSLSSCHFRQSCMSFVR